MKTLVLLFALFSAIASIAQYKHITNESHAFQVLFADSVFEKSSNKSIDQFDFLANDEVLENKGKLILVHTSGKVLQIGKGEVDLLSLSTNHQLSEYHERPIISDTLNFSNQSISLKKRLQGSSIVKSQNLPIDLVSPNTFYIQDLRLDDKDHIFFSWKLDNPNSLNQQDFLFRLTINNEKDEEIYSKVLAKTEHKISSNILGGDKGIFMAEVSLIGTQERWKSIHVPFRYQFVDKTEYDFIVDALSHYYLGNYTFSNFLFKKAIGISAKNPSLIKLYSSFLENSTKLRATSNDFQSSMKLVQGGGEY